MPSFLKRSQKRVMNARKRFSHNFNVGFWKHLKAIFLSLLGTFLVKWEANFMTLQIDAAIYSNAVSSINALVALLQSDSINVKEQAIWTPVSVQEFMPDPGRRRLTRSLTTWSWKRQRNRLFLTHNILPGASIWI